MLGADRSGNESESQAQCAHEEDGPRRQIRRIGDGLPDTRGIVSPLRDVDQTDDKQCRTNYKRIGGAFLGLKLHLRLEVSVLRERTMGPRNWSQLCTSSSFLRCSPCVLRKSNVKPLRTFLRVSTGSMGT